MTVHRHTSDVQRRLSCHSRHSFRLGTRCCFLLCRAQQLQGSVRRFQAFEQRESGRHVKVKPGL
jgi:hypothetical protein